MTATIPVPGSLAVGRVAGAVPAAGRLGVRRVRGGVPRPRSRPVEPQDDRSIGATALGMLSIADGVVAAIASRAVLDIPDAGGVTGGRVLGLRRSESLPKTTAAVDGTTAFVSATVSVRWPAPIAAVADEVRASIRRQVAHMANVTVEEIDIEVDAVIDRPAARQRVR